MFQAVPHFVIDPQCFAWPPYPESCADIMAPKPEADPDYREPTGRRLRCRGGFKKEQFGKHFEIQYGSTSDVGKNLQQSVFNSMDG